MNIFFKDLANHDHVGYLTRKVGTEQTQKLEEIFGDQECKESAIYRCRIRHKYVRLTHEVHKINKIYRDLHAKFLKAIDHMEYHITSERKNKKESIWVRRSSKELNCQ